MSIALFRPTLWSVRLRRHLDSRLVYASPQISNRDYEGEIKGVGDTVHVQRVGDPEVKERKKYEDIDSPEVPEGDRKTLTIDEDWYFNVGIDDLDEWQTNVALLDTFAERAGRGMREVIDSNVASKMVAGAGVELDANPVTIDNGSGADFSFYEFCVECRRLLDNNDAPEDARWMVIPPDLEAVALNDPRVVPAGQGIGDTITRTGEIGTIAGFTILKTTAVPVVEGSGSGAEASLWEVLFGAGNYATTFASELTKLEAYRPEKRFEDALKGMEVWGAAVFEPETLGVAHVSGAPVVEGSGSGSGS
jgi:hypothetical protein